MSNLIRAIINRRFKYAVVAYDGSYVEAHGRSSVEAYDRFTFALDKENPRIIVEIEETG